MNLDHFYLWKKSDTGSGITYLDRKGYTKKISILLKGEDDNVNVYTINNFLASYGISSSLLRKIGSGHAILIHEGKNAAQTENPDGHNIIQEDFS
ncbi:7277_t:CDS:2 [Paraglomus brasilianum]|uniref:7277_t:CDS:1 n=1 Tax=Paraglomus brasilianum TaxID=144538 RepID=A0A9N9D0F9_9GLOM|nr:7277_t:CDS:2 [Paraglomus brasilianum]